MRQASYGNVQVYTLSSIDHGPSIIPIDRGQKGLASQLGVAIALWPKRQEHYPPRAIWSVEEIRMTGLDHPWVVNVVDDWVDPCGRLFERSQRILAAEDTLVMIACRTPFSSGEVIPIIFLENM
jgi:hypothetical protein